MLRVTDQYFWNFVFTVFFLVLVVMGVIILDGEAYKNPDDLDVFDFVLIVLATWRLVRLFVYDTNLKFLREQFWNARKTKTGYILEKPQTGPRRTLADLFSCPWCVGVWAGAVVTFCYLLTPIFFYPILLLGVAAVASFLQIFSNLVGHQAERLKE